MATVVTGNVIACVAALPKALPLPHFDVMNVAIMIYLGAVQIGLAYVLMSRAMQRVPAFEATTVLLLEPVLNPVWTWMVHGERPGGLALAGGALVLAATLVHTWRAGGR